MNIRTQILETIPFRGLTAGFSIDYIRTNQSPLPNYGDRYRNGEPISSSIAESSVNQIISKRFVKKQQMRWGKRGAHLLLQIRTRVLDDTNHDDIRSALNSWDRGPLFTIPQFGQSISITNAESKPGYFVQIDNLIETCSVDVGEKARNHSKGWTLLDARIEVYRKRWQYSFTPRWFYLFLTSSRFSRYGRGFYLSLLYGQAFLYGALSYNSSLLLPLLQNIYS